jgi:hypothetical protein
MSMIPRSIRFEIGPYWILLPRSADISADISAPTADSYQSAWTNWVVTLERFRFGIHLDPINDLSSLKSFIDYSTKGNVTTASITVNGIAGVVHGGYGPPRTWIDWWLKRGDTMICLCMQSKSFPFTEPNEAEIAEHRAIIESIKYCRDFPSEPPPLPA